MATAKKAPTKTKKTSSKTSSAKKKASKKKATQKTTSRKTVKKSAAQKNAPERVLVCADGQSCFWTSDGRILKDLTELRDALSHMAEEVYAHHVTKEKNDFADWVEQVLEDDACATALRKSRKPNTARTVVVRHLKLYAV